MNEETGREEMARVAAMTNGEVLARFWEALRDLHVKASMQLDPTSLEKAAEIMAGGRHDVRLIAYLSSEAMSIDLRLVDRDREVLPEDDGVIFVRIEQDAR